MNHRRAFGRSVVATTRRDARADERTNERTNAPTPRRRGRLWRCRRTNDANDANDAPPTRSPDDDGRASASRGGFVCWAYMGVYYGDTVRFMYEEEW